MRSHGLLTCGRSVASAFLNMYELERACRIQLAAQSGGARLALPGAKVQARLKQQILPPWDLPGMTERLAWPALLRRLDRLDPSYKAQA